MNTRGFGRSRRSRSRSRQHLSPAAQWRKVLHAAYTTAPGSAVHFVAAPFPPERMDFYRDLNPGQANAPPQGPDAMVLRSEPDGTLKQSSMTFGFGRFSLIAAAQSLTALPRWKIEGEAQLLESTLDGDFVVTRGAPTKLILSGLASIISIASGQNLRFVPFKAERDVVVFTGTPKLPLPDTNTGDPPTFTVTLSDRNRELHSTGGQLFNVLDILGVSLNTPMINETTVSNSMVFLTV